MKRKHQPYIIFVVLTVYTFRISWADEWLFSPRAKPTRMQCVEKLHLARRGPASVEIIEWKQDPSRLGKDRGPQSFTWMSTPVLNAEKRLLKYHCCAIYLVQGSRCNLSPRRFGRPFFIPASLICYEFNQVCKFVMHVKLNMQWHIWMWLPYQPPRSSFSIM